MNIIIVGGGKKIHFLTKSFISKGHNVTVINDDREFCRKLAKRYSAKIVNGNGTKPYILEDAEVTAADLVITLTPKDQDNLVICQLASKLFGVEKTLALVNDPENIEVFDKLGVDTTISTPGIISS
ncbi:MAG: TrkA family potassium uptake protein, partial [Candidatus Humimicrobiaceae bacterium]